MVFPVGLGEIRMLKRPNFGLMMLDKAQSERLRKLLSSVLRSRWVAITWQGEEPEIIATAQDPKRARCLAKAQGFKLVILARGTKPSLPAACTAQVK